MKKTYYYQLPGFEGVYLEDSYVLDIKTNANSVDIFLEVVLTDKHSQYTSPKPNEQYCYRNAHIYFPNAKETAWAEKSMIPSEDANGEVDYGNIDEFYLVDGYYHIAGDWGALNLVSSLPKFDLL